MKLSGILPLRDGIALLETVGGGIGCEGGRDPSSSADAGMGSAITGEVRFRQIITGHQQWPQNLSGQSTLSNTPPGENAKTMMMAGDREVR